MKRNALVIIILTLSCQLLFAEPGYGISGPFTLDTIDPIVQITNPTLGMEVMNGDTMPITWNSDETNIPPNCINLYWRSEPDALWGMISQNEPDNGQYDWPILENGTDTAQIQISLRDAFGNLGYGLSDPFTILQPDEPQEVSITSDPTGAKVYIDGVFQGLTPHTAMLNPGESFTVSVQKLGYSFSPLSQFVEWINEPIFVHFVGTFTNPGTVIHPLNIPNVWVLEDSPYNIVDSIEIAVNRNIVINEGVEVLNYTSASIPVYGSLNATTAIFKSVFDSLYWGGLEFIGSNNTRTISYLSGCQILNSNSPLNILDCSPVIDSLQIALIDSLATMNSTGILINGVSAPNLHNVLITNYETGIQITADELTGQNSPTLTNVRIRNTSSSLRQSRFPVNANPHGIKIVGCSTAILNDIEINNYLTGIKIENDSLLTVSSPTLTNVRIRNTSSTIRTESKGIVLSGYQNTSINDSQVIDYNLGIVINSNNPVLGSSPTLTNVRIRNTSSCLREPSIGVYVGEFTSPTLNNCQIWEADTGAVAMVNSIPVILNNTFINCITGVRSFSDQLSALKKNLFVVEDSWAIDHPTFPFTGMDISANNDLLVQNNTFYGYAKVLKLSNSTCMFENNIAWDDGLLTAPFVRINSSLTAAYNDVFAGPGAYTGVSVVGNINANPLFVNPAENDFHLHFNSPCIDSGNPSTANDTDGTRADMGAFPYMHKADFLLPLTDITANINVTFTNTSIGHDDPSSIVQWSLLPNGSIESCDRNWTTSFATAGIYFLQLTMITGNLIDQSSVYQFTVLPGGSLESPGNLNARVNEGQLILTWDAVSGAQSYKVLVSDDPDGAFIELNGSEGSFGSLGDRITWTISLTGLSRKFFQIVACEQ